MSESRCIRSLVVALACVVSLASAALWVHAQGGHGVKPNIILIVGDDVGWGDLGV